MVKVSVIVPVYNAEKYIKRCVDSILRQTYRDFEVIFVNDGSTDNSLFLLEKYQKNSEINIRIISQENSGQAMARNKGICEATGEFICFIDIDDYVCENLLEKLIVNQEETSADIVWCDAYVVREGKIEGTLDQNCIIYPNDTINYMLKNASPWRKIIRKTLLIEHQLYFPKIRFYEDFAVVPAYAIYTNRISYINKSLYYYDLHEGSTMHQTFYNKKLECIFDAMRYLKSKCDGQYQMEIEYLCIDHLLHAASLRFFQFDEGKDMLIKVADLMKEEYPNWQNNSYFKKKDWKYKLVCKLFYNRKYKILGLLLK